jgi:hypothetical protein
MVGDRGGYFGLHDRAVIERRLYRSFGLDRD